MGYYHLNLDALAEYTGKTVEELKNLSYTTLEAKIKDMENDKIIKRNNRNANDKEYERLVLKYFRPVPMLRHWFEDREIVLACARTGVTDRDLCGETFVPVNGKCHYKDGEYIRTSVESIIQYDKKGRELAERVREKRDVYRVAARYQGLCHGKAILYALYQRHPDLAKFGFTAYDASYETDYEIYPTNNIYTSFAALLSGDVDWIIHRNREYCHSYNNGRHTTAECEKMFKTDEAQEMFNLIRSIGIKEQALGHSPFYTDEEGNLVHMGGLKETSASKSGNVKIVKKELRTGVPKTDKRIFKLHTAAPYSAEQLIREFLELNQSKYVSIHILHLTDHLGEHGIHMRFELNPESDRPTTHGYLALGKGPKCDDDKFENVAGCIVHDTFGWTQDRNGDLIIRIDCPDINK